MTYMSSQTSSLEPGGASVTYPTGWFWVAWSHEVSVEDAPRPLRYFGRDLVLYRGASGRPVVLDAHCPHLGAHLGYGGSVCDDDIVCPFHGWRWAPDGSNVEIPYDDKISTSRRSEEHTSELQSLMRISYAVFCLQKKKTKNN